MELKSLIRDDYCLYKIRMAKGPYVILQLLLIALFIVPLSSSIRAYSLLQRKPPCWSIVSCILLKSPLYIY